MTARRDGLTRYGPWPLLGGHRRAAVVTARRDAGPGLGRRYRSARGRGPWPGPGRRHAAGHEAAAPGRLPRLFPSPTLLRPSLRSLFSYSEGSRGVAKGKGRSGPRVRRASSPVRRCPGEFPGAAVVLADLLHGGPRAGPVAGSLARRKRWPARIFHPRSRTTSAPKWRNDAIPHERGSRRAPESYARATFPTPSTRPAAPAPVQYSTCPPPDVADAPGSARPPSSPTPPPSSRRWRARDRTPRSARSSLNPRARTPSRRARGLCDDLAG